MVVNKKMAKVFFSSPPYGKKAFNLFIVKNQQGVNLVEVLIFHMDIATISTVFLPLI